MPPKNNPPPLQDVRDAFQDLYDNLRDAYWAASDIATKDRIYGTEEIVFDTLADLDREYLEQNSAVYKEVKGKIAPVLDKLDQLKADIDKIIRAVDVATQVAGALDKAIALASKYFGI